LAATVVQFDQLLETNYLDTIVKSRPNDYYVVSDPEKTNYDETWAMNYREANFIPAFQPARGPRFNFRNVTIWSGPSYQRARKLIDNSIAKASGHTTSWRDSRKGRTQERKSKNSFAAAIKKPWLVALLLAGVITLALGTPCLHVTLLSLHVFSLVPNALQ
jgi:hypothetical protein